MAFTATERWQLGTSEHSEIAAASEAPSPTTKVLILGQPLAAFAPELEELTDFEEMVLALVHPLVQVYSVPSTGELAYVGHVCNFRQRVSKFLSSLPTLPVDMPFVLVRHVFDLLVDKAGLWSKVCQRCSCHS